MEANFRSLLLSDTRTLFLRLGILLLLVVGMTIQKSQPPSPNLPNLEEDRKQQIYLRFLSLVNDHRHIRVGLPPSSALTPHPPLHRKAQRIAQAVASALQQVRHRKTWYHDDPQHTEAWGHKDGLLLTVPQHNTKLRRRDDVNRKSWSGLTGPSPWAHPLLIGTSYHTLDPLVLWRTWMRQGLSRQKLEWLGFNQSGWGFAPASTGVWVVVHLLASDPHKLYRGLHERTFLHVRTNNEWRVARSLQGIIDSPLQDQPCEAVPFQGSCYRSQQRFVLAQDVCNKRIYRLSIAQENHSFHRFDEPFPRFDIGTRIQFRKGQGWVDGNLVYIAHHIENIPILYGVLHRHTHENVCFSAIRKPEKPKGNTL